MPRHQWKDEVGFSKDIVIHMMVKLAPRSRKVASNVRSGHVRGRIHLVISRGGDPSKFEELSPLIGHIYAVFLGLSILPQHM